MYIVYIREYIYDGNVLVLVLFSREDVHIGLMVEDVGSKRRLGLGPHMVSSGLELNKIAKQLCIVSFLRFSVLLQFRGDPRHSFDFESWIRRGGSILARGKTLGEK
jgi:hypothetical protein